MGLQRVRHDLVTEQQLSMYCARRWEMQMSKAEFLPSHCILV